VTLSVPVLTAAEFALRCQFEPAVIDSSMGLDSMLVSSWISNIGDVEAQGVEAQISIPAGYALAAGQSVLIGVPDPIAPGDSARVEWVISAASPFGCGPEDVTVEIAATDRFGLQESCDAVGRIIYPENLLPEITAFEPAALDTADKDSEIRFAVTVFDEEGAELTYRWFVDGGEVQNDTPEYMHTFDAVGMHDVRVEIYDPCTVDGGEAVEQVWSFFVRDPTGIADDPAALRAFDITGNYPNPFNPGTVIEYRVPDGRHEVRLDVIDAYGRVVRTLVDDVRSGGVYRQSFDADGLPSGTYIARLRSATTVRMHRMVLVK
jgi:hypothetical protein